MANSLYPYYKQVCLDTGHTDHVDMNTDTVKIALVEGGSYDSTDKYMSDLVADAGVTVVARSSALASPTVSNGTFDAADKTLTAVTTGHTIIAVVVYKDSGADASSTLIAYIDHDPGNASISLPTNGSDITVQFDASGIFDL